MGPPPDGVYDIVRNTTPEHFMRLPFNALVDVQKLEITYQQDDIATIIKTLDDMTIAEENPFVVYYQFTEEETQAFQAIPNTPVGIQVRALLMNGDVVASEIYKVKVLEVLSENNLVEKEEELEE